MDTYALFSNSLTQFSFSSVLNFFVLLFLFVMSFYCHIDKHDFTRKENKNSSLWDDFSGFRCPINTFDLLINFTFKLLRQKKASKKIDCTGVSFAHNLSLLQLVCFFSQSDLFLSICLFACIFFFFRWFVIKVT